MALVVLLVKNLLDCIITFYQALSIRHKRDYSFSRASTVMRHMPFLKKNGGVMDGSRAG
jgi:hypothetical protein